MKTNLLPYYIYERLHSIQQHLKAYQKDRDPKRLHLLRLDIKKMNALYAFLDHCHEEKFHAPDLKNLFKTAGIIREHHIHVDIMKKFIGFPEKFIQQLKKETLKREDEFVKTIPVHVHVISHLEKVLLLPVELPSKKVIHQYFKKEQKHISKESKSSSRKKIHDCRTHIKRLLYVYFALPETFQNKISLNRRALQQKEVQIGQWHDTKATLDFLKSEGHKTELKNLIDKLKKQEKSEFDLLLKVLSQK